MAPINVNEIVVIESLPAKDTLRTGEDLYQNLLSADALPVRLIQASSALDLSRSIAELTKLARQAQWVPVIHLEIHGAADKSGLVVASGEFIPWETFAAWIRGLNIATKNSVLVVLGVCSGLYLSTAAAVNPFEPAPFYGVIGPDRTINPFVMYHGFLAFYRELLTSVDIAKAVDALRSHSLPEYSGLDTAMLFRRGMARYDKTQLAGPGLTRRVKKGLRKVPAGEITRLGGRNKARMFFAAKVREVSAAKRDQFYEHFIMADVYPENAERFPPLDAS